MNSRSGESLARRAWFVPAVLAGSIVLLVGPAQARPGTIDPSFGSVGVVRTAFDKEPNSEAAVNAVAIQPDGKIIAAGGSTEGQSIFDFDRFSIARYKPNGSLDPSFGRKGKVSIAFCCAGGARGIALQPDGKIVVASSEGLEEESPFVFALVRLNPDGSADSSFGSNGTVRTQIGTGSGAYDVAVQPDGKIVVAGWSDNGTRTSFALARYKPDGSLDPTFGPGGTVTTPVGPQFDFARALALQPDGKIIAGGYTYLAGDQTDLALARYKPDGSLDMGFGTGGKVTTGVPGYKFIFDIALRSNGKIVTAGSDGPSSLAFFSLRQYNPDGSPDTAFGANGAVTTKVGDGRSFATALALRPDGRIVAAGDAEAPHPWTFGLARYKDDGSLDPSFGSGGKVTNPVGSANAVVLQPDGKIVAAGDSGARFEIVRYLSGKERCIVPKVRGKRLAKAKQTLHGAYCLVGRIKRDFSSTVRKGRVISQTPKPGARRPARAKVKLVVSKGRRKAR
jgi:uncharacterized delta-60 repeat protein